MRKDVGAVGVAPLRPTAALLSLLAPPSALPTGLRDAQLHRLGCDGCILWLIGFSPPDLVGGECPDSLLGLLCSLMGVSGFSQSHEGEGLPLLVWMEPQFYLWCLAKAERQLSACFLSC